MVFVLLKGQFMVFVLLKGQFMVFVLLKGQFMVFVLLKGQFMVFVLFNWFIDSQNFSLRTSMSASSSPLPVSQSSCGRGSW